MKKPFLNSLIVSCTYLLIACDSQPITQKAIESVSIANPASSYCIEQGGELSIEDQEGGQVGYCTLPSGERVEEWQFYRLSFSTPQAEPTKNTQIPNNRPQQGKETFQANPAAKYCLYLNGKLNPASGMCTLPDGEIIEQWTLYKRANKELQEVTEMLKTPAAGTEECAKLGGITDLSDNTCKLPPKNKIQ